LDVLGHRALGGKGGPVRPRVQLAYVDGITGLGEAGLDVQLRGLEPVPFEGGSAHIDIPADDRRLEIVDLAVLDGPGDVGRQVSLGLYLDARHGEQGRDGVQIQVVDVHCEIPRGAPEAPAGLPAGRDLSGGPHLGRPLGLGDRHADIKTRGVSCGSHVQRGVQIGDLHGFAGGARELDAAVANDQVVESGEVIQVHRRAFFSSRGLGCRRPVSQVDGHPRLIDHRAVQGQCSAEQAAVARLGRDSTDVHLGPAVLAAEVEVGGINALEPAYGQIAYIRLAARAATDRTCHPLRESPRGENHRDQQHDQDDENDHAAQNPGPSPRSSCLPCLARFLCLLFHVSPPSRSVREIVHPLLL
jgi:hypothetical protein